MGGLFPSCKIVKCENNLILRKDFLMFSLGCNQSKDMQNRLQGD
jgi:hypothetical protein